MFQIVLLLFAGAIVNVAVAWGCAIWGTVNGTSVIDATADASKIMAEVGLRQTDNQYATRSKGALLTITSVVAEDETSHIVIVSQAGWPVHSMTGTLHLINYQDPDQPDVLRLYHAVELSNAIRPRNRFAPTIPFVLPLCPEWPGFAINTLFYSAILWTLFVFPFMLRRRVRIRRGLCPACGYPVGTSNVCTECGVAVKTQKLRNAETQKAETT